MITGECVARIGRMEMILTVGDAVKFIDEKLAG